MARGWLTPPSVMVLTGTHEFLLTREIQKAVRAAKHKGRRVDWVDAKTDWESVLMSLAGTAIFSDPCMVVVENPEAVDPDVVLAHHESGDDEVVLVLYHKGNPRSYRSLGKLIERLPKNRHISFQAPKPWEEEKAAISFIKSEVALIGKEIADRTVISLVRAVGPELGKLSFEILKVKTYMDAVGEGPEIKPEHLKETLASIREADWTPLINAVGRADLKGVLRGMSSIRRNVRQDPLMKTTTWLGNQVVRWLHVAHLLDGGLGLKEIASRIGMHSYAMQKQNLVPVARLWGVEDLVRLLDGIVSVERAARSGQISPWIRLECVLMARCGAVRRRG